MIRGTVLHELVNLPFYWKAAADAPDVPYPIKKVPFGNHPRQYCLVIEPATRPKAWIVYWHGGGWQFGSPEQFQKTANAWLEAGYGVIIPSYRRLPWYDFRAIRRDTIDALVACRHYWEENNGDPSPPVVLLGMSAGGHLAAITGLDAGIWQQAGWQSEQIKGVIACGAVLDLSMMKNNPIIRLLAGSSQGTTFSQANPSAQLATSTAHIPPFLLIHGTKDGMAPYQAATNFQKRLQEIPSAACELITMQEGTHLDAARWMFHDTPLRQRIIARAEEWTNTAI
jgi:acetyl esterase/lipase